LALNTEPEKLEIFRSIYSIKNRIFEELIDKYLINKFDLGCKN
jgi:hypothetical protein